MEKKIKLEQVKSSGKQREEFKTNKQISLFQFCKTSHVSSDLHKLEFYLNQSSILSMKGTMDFKIEGTLQTDIYHKTPA